MDSNYSASKGDYLTKTLRQSAEELDTNNMEWCLTKLVETEADQEANCINRNSLARYHETLGEFSKAAGVSEQSLGRIEDWRRKDPENPKYERMKNIAAIDLDIYSKAAMGGSFINEIAEYKNKVSSQSRRVTEQAALDAYRHLKQLHVETTKTYLELYKLGKKSLKSTGWDEPSFKL